MSTSAASTYAAFRNSSYFPSLNGIRALCALLVIKEHAQWKIAREPQMIGWGFLGVDMFFVISGFLIVTLLLRERDRAGQIDLKQFYVRRTLRIFPIYYLLVAAIFIVAVATYGHSPRTWDLYKWSIPIFLLYLQDLVPISMGLMFHTWSLAMEEQFYLVWPSVERFVKASWVVPLLVLLIVLGQLCNFGFFAEPITALYGAGGPARPIFMITFTPILLGVLAAHAMHDPKIGEAICGVLKNRWMPLLLLAATLLVCQFSSALQGATRLSVHVLFCLTLMSLVINPKGVFSGFLQSRVMFYLGSVSYGIYLYHTFLLWGIARAFDSHAHPLSPFVLFLIGTPLAIGLAALSFRFFETPIMNLRHRRAARRLAAASHQGA
jgi:peptidoglycan/LPS O-acetylase OafA/YrhL